MLILSQNGLVYLATPKTGSTAVEQTLGNLADIRFSRRRKHQNARFYHNRVAPFLKASLSETNEVIAVIREPMDWLRSWYRYRVRLPKDNPRSTDGDGSMILPELLCKARNRPSVPLAGSSTS